MPLNALSLLLLAVAMFRDPDGVKRAIGAGVVKIVVPPGRVGVADCTYDAAFQNAAIIYSNDASPVELMRCGNTPDNVRNAPLTMSPGTYYVTAWHKDAYLGDADVSAKPWTTSITKADAPSADVRRVLAEDGTDNDFNDVIVTIRLITSREIAAAPDR